MGRHRWDHPRGRRLGRPRGLRRLAAAVLGFFWLPCPCCDEPFAGFEDGGRLWEEAVTRDGALLSVSGRVTCPGCPGDLGPAADRFRFRP